MKKTLLCVLFCLMGCFLFSACGSHPIPDPEGIMEPTQALYDGLDALKSQELQAKTSLLGQEQYCIVVDDGLGMKGFISQYCQSYRAALGAASSVSIGNPRTCLCASDVQRGSSVSKVPGDEFFQSAMQEDFFAGKSTDIASIIEKLAEQSDRNTNQVTILISDLMLPSEDASRKAAAALQKYIIKPEHKTMGIIAIVGDFRGMIDNLPVSQKTGQIRKVSDYMVKERDSNGNFRHPLYLIFLGDDQAVLNAMEKALSSLDGSGLLDETTPRYALYFSEYGVNRVETDGVTTKFNLGCHAYDRANYPAENIVSGVKNDAGTIRYPTKNGEEMPEAYQQLLSKVPVVKLYNQERGNTEENVTLNCKIPYALVDSSENGASIADPYNLVVPAKKLSLDHDDYSVTTEIRVLNYVADGTGTKANWTEPESNLVSCESATIDEGCKKINVVLSVDTQQLSQDVPLLVQIDIRVSIDPQLEELNSLYQTDWVKDMTLSLRQFDIESAWQSEAVTSARYSKATTEKTPFLSNLICQGICDQQMLTIGDTIRATTQTYVQTAMFGLVVRNVPGHYSMDGTWDDTEDFRGWAFSIEDAQEIIFAMK